MALHTPTIHAPAALHVPGWLQAVVLAAIVMLLLGVGSQLVPQSQPAAVDDLYQEYRAGERSVVFDSAVQRAWQDYRAGERDMK